MACPVIKYGIPEEGAYTYATNSGRELFRCGTSCVKMYITNVSVEKSLVKYVCGNVNDADIGTFGCMESFTVNYRDRVLENWIAKDNVDSSLPNGYVITRVGACKDLQGVIYLYTEGRLSARMRINIENLTPDNADAVKEKVLEKLQNISTIQNKSLELDWIFNDLNVDVNPTDWQRGSVSYLGFGVKESQEATTYRINFNYNNGRGEEAHGVVIYDDTPTPQYLANIIRDLITR